MQNIGKTTDLRNVSNYLLGLDVVGSLNLFGGFVLVF
jgi:hypothetical protein